MREDLAFQNMFVSFHLFTLMEDFWIHQEYETSREHAVSVCLRSYSAVTSSGILEYKSNQNDVQMFNIMIPTSFDFLLILIPSWGRTSFG